MPTKTTYEIHAKETRTFVVRLAAQNGREAYEQFMNDYSLHATASNQVHINTELTVSELKRWPESVNLIDETDEEIDTTSTPEQLLWSNVMRQNPLEFLALNARAYNLIAHADIETMWDLLTYTREELLDLPKMGKKTVDHIIDTLAEVGLFLPQVPLK